MRRLSGARWFRFALCEAVIAAGGQLVPRGIKAGLHCELHKKVPDRHAVDAFELVDAADIILCVIGICFFSLSCRAVFVVLFL